MANRRRKYVRVRTWDTTDSGYFPERHDPEVKIQALDEKADLGVCFSGGGTRSASATLGQLRGLRNTNILDRVRYLCAVSGGSWTATPFTYLPDSFDDDTFLGPHVDPQGMTDEDLQYAPDGSMAEAIHRSVLFDKILKNWTKLRGDESYARAIGDIFLDRFGLDETSKFFTWDERSLEAVMQNNSRSVGSSNYLQRSDFVLAKSDRPYLIVGATLLFGPDKAQTVVPMEITPLYTGCRQHLKNKGKNGADIGGCYVESFGYDSKYKEEDISESPMRVRFWSNSNLRSKKK